MPPIEITSSSGCGENTSTRCRIGSLERPRILSFSRLNTSPLMGPGAPYLASSGPVALPGATPDLGLVLARRDEDDFLGGEDRRAPHRDGLARHVVFAEEVGRRVLAGDGVEPHQAGARVGRRARLVEADVPALADAQELQCDAARVRDGALVGAARFGQLFARDGAGRGGYVRSRDVD